MWVGLAVTHPAHAVAADEECVGGGEEGHERLALCAVVQHHLLPAVAVHARELAAHGGVADRDADGAAEAAGRVQLTGKWEEGWEGSRGPALSGKAARRGRRTIIYDRTKIMVP